jgi:hypothetical protein
MGRPRAYSDKTAKELYRQTLLVLFKFIVFTLAILDWLKALLKKWLRIP